MPENSKNVQQLFNELQPEVDDGGKKTISIEKYKELFPEIIRAICKQNKKLDEKVFNVLLLHPISRNWQAIDYNTAVFLDSELQARLHGMANRVGANNQPTDVDLTLQLFEIRNLATARQDQLLGQLP